MTPLTLLPDMAYWVTLLYFQLCKNLRTVTTTSQDLAGLVKLGVATLIDMTRNTSVSYISKKSYRGTVLTLSSSSMSGCRLCASLRLAWSTLLTLFLYFSFSTPRYCWTRTFFNVRSVSVFVEYWRLVTHLFTEYCCEFLYVSSIFTGFLNGDFLSVLR